MLELIVPGSSAVLEVLDTISQLCGEMDEGQGTCSRFHFRLKEIFEELVKMENNQQLPLSDALDTYVGVVAKYLQYLEEYRGKLSCVASFTTKP